MNNFIPINLTTYMMEKFFLQHNSLEKEHKIRYKSTDLYLSEKIYLLLKNPLKKTPGLDSIKHLVKNNTNIKQILSANRKEKIFSNSLDEASTNLTGKLTKTFQENYRAIVLINIVQKSFT